MNINYSIPLDALCDQEGNYLQTLLPITCGESFDVTFAALDSNGDETDLSGAVSWQLQIADDLSASSPILIQVPSSGITYDSTARTLSFNLNPSSWDFFTAVNGKSQVLLFVRLCGIDGNDENVFDFNWQMVGKMPVSGRFDNDSSAIAQSITVSGNTVAFCRGAAIYRFSPTVATTLSFSPPPLLSGEVYRCELWITQTFPAVTLTLPAVVWQGGTSPDLSSIGLYQIALTFDGFDWYGRVLLVRDNAFHGSYENGDPGVYCYQDGNLIHADYNATGWELSVISGTIYVIGNTTTLSGSTIGSGVYIETNKQQGNDYIGGGTISNCTLSGGTILAVNTVFNGLIANSGGIAATGGTFTNCFFGHDLQTCIGEHMLENITIVGGTINCAPSALNLALNGVTIDVNDYFENVSQAVDCLFLSGTGYGFNVSSGTVNGMVFDSGTISGNTLWLDGSVLIDAMVSGIPVVNITLDSGTISNCVVSGVLSGEYGGTILGGTISSGAHLKYSSDYTVINNLVVLAGCTVSVYSGYGDELTNTYVVSTAGTINNTPQGS